MSGGGEFLRGVLEQTCKFGQTAYYSVECPARPGAPGWRYGNALQVKQDRYFLCQSVCFVYGLSAGMPLDPDRGEIEIFDPLTSKVYTSLAGPQQLYGNCANFVAELPEYILFGPAQLINFRVSRDGWSAADNITMVMSGIEYGV